MQNEMSISRKPPDHVSMDYAALRKEGLSRIQELASSVWTDYNTHDPGVTMLEILCYAITDLGYRSSHPVEDLLASDPGNRTGSTNDFFEAHEVFPNHPLAINDFRKFLIDLPGIRNAWVEKAGTADQKIWFDENSHQLTYDETGQEIRVKGLMNAMLELYAEDGGPEGAWNIFPGNITINDGPTDRILGLQVSSPHFLDTDPLWTKPFEITEVKVVLSKNDDWPEKSLNQYKAHLKISRQGSEETEHLHVKVRIMATAQEIAGHKAALESKLKGFLAREGEEGLVHHFHQAMINLRQQMEETGRLLHQYRNLCEDFVLPSPVRIQEVAIDGLLEVPLDTPVEEFLARVYFDIGSFIDPPIRFYSLKELLDEGISSEEIFDGPLTRHGFIRDGNLEAFNARDAIFLSDLLQLIMDTDKARVIALKGLSLTNYIDNDVITSHALNCLHLYEPEKYKPRLSIEKSGLQLTKRGIVQKYDRQKMIDLFNDLVRAAEPDKMIEPVHELELPKGTDRETSHYSSIQESLPATYGAGKEGLPGNAAEHHRAQVRQLKGYLLVFDQLFAQYLAQLSNLKNIFSVDSGVNRTYFQQAVYQVPGAMFLLKDFIGAQSSLDDDTALEAAWDLFRADPGNDYIDKLGSATEDEALFLQRRNRFLDHLMARFCEEMTDLSMYAIGLHEQQVTKSLVIQKENFLNNFPALSGDRGRGFDLWPGGQPVWDCEDVTGIRKRVSALLGFTDHSRRFLTGGDFGFIEFYQEKDTDLIDEYRFRIRNGEDEIILSGTRAYKVLEEGYEVVYQVLETGKDENRYKVLPSSDGRFYYNLYDEANKVIARRIRFFDTEEEAIQAMEDTVEFFLTHFQGVHDEPGEGFFIVEHLNLRPKYGEFAGGGKVVETLLPVILDDYGELLEAGKDPYSFRISVIFPLELEKFSDPGFRELAERQLRLETPAHVMPQVYFVNNIQLSRFERAYREWITLSASVFPEDPEQQRKHKEAVSNALHRLIAAMQFTPQLPGI